MGVIGEGSGSGGSGYSLRLRSEPHWMGGSGEGGCVGRAEAGAVYVCGLNHTATSAAFEVSGSLERQNAFEGDVGPNNNTVPRSIYKYIGRYDL